MRTYFKMDFHSGFRPDFNQGFRPMDRTLGPVRVLGQDIITSVEESPSTGWTPDQTTSTQAPLAPAPVAAPPPQTPIERPTGTSDTDWAKILSEGLKAASAGYGTYTTEQIAKMKAEADILRAKNPSVASLLPSTSSATTTMALVVGGILFLGLIVVVAVK